MHYWVVGQIWAACDKCNYSLTKREGNGVRIKTEIILGKVKVEISPNLMEIKPTDSRC